MKCNANKDRVEYMLKIKPDEGASFPLSLEISFTQGESFFLPVGMQARIITY